MVTARRRGGRSALTRGTTDGNAACMANVGRNDPCACGSGKKFKHCHLRIEEAAKGETQRAARLHDLDRRLVDRALEYAYAHQEFEGDWLLDLLDAIQLDELDAHRAQLVVPCSVYEWAPHGATLLERFLQASNGELSGEERGWLEAQRRAWLSIWEVQTVTPGVDVTLRDLLTGEERRVLERRASRTLVARDAVLGRIVDFEGLSVFCGMYPRALPPTPAAALVTRFREELRTPAGCVSLTSLRGIPFEAWFMAWDAAFESLDRASEGDDLSMGRTELVLRDAALADALGLAKATD